MELEGEPTVQGRRCCLSASRQTIAPASAAGRMRTNQIRPLSVETDQCPLSEHFGKLEHFLTHRYGPTALVECPRWVQVRCPGTSMRSPFGSLNIRHALDGMARQFRRNFGSQSPPSVAALRERERERW
jgi:hypothetical protein